jgi:outer membrane lipopolysaccharide assembly protein LptE/RlpB
MTSRPLTWLVLLATIFGLTACGIERRQDRREERRDDRKDLVQQTSQASQASERAASALWPAQAPRIT